MSADVCVVGAGFAGLTTARQLVRAGHDVVVLEARDRVGGRVLNERLSPGVITELGGEFIGPTQDRIRRWRTRSASTPSRPTTRAATSSSSTGRAASTRRRRASPTTPTSWPRSPRCRSARQMAAEVPVAAPWKAPRADEWDKQTFAQFRDQKVATPGGRAIFDVAARAIWGARPGGVLAPLRAVLHRGRRQPGHARLVGAAHDHRRRRAGRALRRRLAGRCAEGGRAARSPGRARRARAPHRDHRQGRGDRERRRRRGRRPPCRCRRAAGARRQDRLRAGAAIGQAQAAQEDHARQPDQARGDLRPPVLARPEPQRPGRTVPPTPATRRSTTRPRRARPGSSSPSSAATPHAPSRPRWRRARRPTPTTSSPSSARSPGT